MKKYLLLIAMLFASIGAMQAQDIFDPDEDDEEEHNDDSLSVPNEDYSFESE